MTDLQIRILAWVGLVFGWTVALCGGYFAALFFFGVALYFFFVDIYRHWPGGGGPVKPA